MGRFRKKPVEIDAYEFQNKVGADTRPDWIKAAVARGDVVFHPSRKGPGHLTIATLEGVMRAEIGDWIIRGVKGELYPCKPDIFATTYEPVAAHQHECAHHPGVAAVTNLDGDDLCHDCADAWVRAEGDWQHYLEDEVAHQHEGDQRG